MKTFKEFNEKYNPSPNIDKKREAKKMSNLSVLDKMGRFIPFDKKFLEDCGFEIKINNPTEEKYMTERQECGATLKGVDEIAESSIDKYRIIVWKYSPPEEQYMFVAYHYYILDSRRTSFTMIINSFIFSIFIVYSIFHNFFFITIITNRCYFLMRPNR